MCSPLRGKGTEQPSLEAQGFLFRVSWPKKMVLHRGKSLKVPSAVFSTQSEILTRHGANQRMTKTRLRWPRVQLDSCARVRRLLAVLIC